MKTETFLNYVLAILFLIGMVIFFVLVLREKPQCEPTKVFVTAKYPNHTHKEELDTINVKGSEVYFETHTGQITIRKDTSGIHIDIIGLIPNDEKNY